MKKIKNSFKFGNQPRIALLCVLIAAGCVLGAATARRAKLLLYQDLVTVASIFFSLIFVHCNGSGVNGGAGGRPIE